MPHTTPRIPLISPVSPLLAPQLKARMKARGDTGNIKRAEQTLDVVEKVQADVASLTAKVDAILAHLSIPQPTTMAR